MLIKKETVLDFLQESKTGKDVFFSAPKGESFAPVAVHLYREVYEDMGRPQQITVTIVPGDALNPEAP